MKCMVAPQRCNVNDRARGEKEWEGNFGWGKKTALQEY